MRLRLRDFASADAARKTICSKGLCGPIRHSRRQLASLSNLDAWFAGTDVNEVAPQLVISSAARSSCRVVPNNMSYCWSSARRSVVILCPIEGPNV
jgi:hypothetical protein